MFKKRENRNVDILGVASTPLQLINILEFVNSTPNQISYQILIVCSDKINFKQMAELANANCLLLFKDFQNQTFMMRWVLKSVFIRFFINYSKYSKIVIGNYNNAIHFYLANLFYLNKKDVILIDDGLATFQVWLQRARNSKAFLSKNSFQNFLLRTILKKGENRIGKITFYSKYFLTSLGNSDDEYIQVEPVVVIKPLNINIIYFLGSPLVEKNILKERDYINIVNKIGKYYKLSGKSIFYIPHRQETLKSIDLDLIIYNKPIEIILEKELEQIPAFFISFYSTALINITSHFHGVKAKYINITDYCMDNDLVEKVKIIYEYFKNVQNYEEIDYSLM